VSDTIFVDNSKEVLAALDGAILRALERCGMQAEGYAKDLVPVDTGNLRNSISHRVDEKENVVYIGTNSEYGAYVELGTGKYYKGGRQDPWVYQDKEGRWHHTNGQRAQPYLKPAVANHKQTYKNIIKDELENA
jgi:HK97 gp10 family phage protein